MISNISDIMTRKIYTIDAYDGVCKAERIMDEKDICCLSVMQDEKLVGVLTSKDIRKSHPNRIVADAMPKELVSVSPDTSLWKAKQIFEEYKIETLLVEKKGNPIGVVTKTCLYEELGKRSDLLTGLYKSDYIYQAGMELLEKGDQISVIFIDLNNFGQIDKEYGHIQGDIILSELGMLLKEYSQKDVFLCRFGGDEFVILTQYELEKCVGFADMLLKAISANKYPNDIQVTASAGIAAGSWDKQEGQGSFEKITNIINQASLASTRAKKEKVGLIVSDCFLVDDIAYL